MAKLCDGCSRPMGRIVGDSAASSGYYCSRCSARVYDQPAEGDDLNSILAESRVGELTLRRRPVLALEVEPVADGDARVLRLPPLRPDWQEAVARSVAAAAETLEGGGSPDEAVAAAAMAGEADERIAGGGVG